MKTGDIVFLRRPYKGYRAVELMERLECRSLAGQDCRERS